jgi:hypothetical protein
MCIDRAERAGEDELDGEDKVLGGPHWDACHALKEEVAFVPSLRLFDSISLLTNII